MNGSINRTVAGFLGLYERIGLTIGAYAIVETFRQDGPSTSGAVAYRFFALIVTLIPFFFGTSRCLHRDFVLSNLDDGDAKAIKSLEVTLPIVSVQAAAFLALAVLLRSPEFFVPVFGLILLIDIGWGLWLYVSHGRHARAGGLWFAINLSHLVAIGMAWWVIGDSESVRLAQSVAILAGNRTLLDCLLLWDDLYNAGST